jgi:hypothetical protein
MEKVLRVRVNWYPSLTYAKLSKRMSLVTWRSPELERKSPCAMPSSLLSSFVWPTQIPR